MYADDEIEDHAHCKRQSGESQYNQRSSFAENLNDDERLETVVDDETNEWEEEIQNIESDIS